MNDIKTNIDSYKSLKEIDDTHRYLYYLEKMNLEDLILRTDKEILKKIIVLKIFMITKKLNHIAHIKKYIANTQYDKLYCDLKNNQKETSIELILFSILRDIDVLQKDKILSSRLAIVLYRLANLDFLSNTIKIGKIIHKMVCVKSRIYSAKKFKLDKKVKELFFTFQFVNYENVRGYKINMKRINNSFKKPSKISSIKQSDILKKITI